MNNNIDILSLPKSRHGWLAGIFLAIILYFFYYLPGGGYQALNVYYYGNTFAKIEFRVKDIIGKDDPCNSVKDISISLYYPESFAPYVPHKVILIIKKITDSPKVIMNVILSSQDLFVIEESRSSIDPAIIAIDQEVRLIKQVSYLDNSENKTIKKPFTISVNGCLFKEFQAQQQDINVKTYSGTINTMIGTALLPPWSNIIIFFFSLFLVWFVEKRASPGDQDVDIDPFTKKGILLILLKTKFAAWLATVVILFFTFLILIAQQDNLKSKEFWVWNNPLFAYLVIIICGVFLFILSNQRNLRKEIQSFVRRKNQASLGSHYLVNYSVRQKWLVVMMMVSFVGSAILLWGHYSHLGEDVNGWNVIMTIVMVFSYWILGACFWGARQVGNEKPYNSII